MDAAERRSRATDEASYWWHQLGSRTPAGISASDRQRFTQWLRESPLHVAEMLHIAHVHDALERFKLWQEIATDSTEDGATVVPIDDAKPPSAKDLRSHAAQRRRFWAIAAGVAFLPLATSWVALHFRDPIIATGRAERHEVMLNDGSIVRLEPETTLRIAFREHARHLTLERGRALFHVAKDKSRPFSVEADDTVVRALGTAFGIERNDRKIIVTVSEGEVAVLSRAGSGMRETETSPRHRDAEGAAQWGLKAAAPQDHSLGTAEKESLPTTGQVEVRRQGAELPKRTKLSGAPIFLTAGRQLSVLRSGAAESVHDVDIRRALAWTEGRLVFESTPLVEVIQEFNRYNHVQLHVHDPELARRRVSGVFQASDLETLVAFIRTGVSVEVTYESTEKILIAPSPRKNLD